jgi:hypothetical protein
MKNEEKSMIIDMAKKSIIPNAMSKLKNEVDKLTINITKEEARVIFESIDDSHVTLINKIDQLRSFFKFD